MLLFAVIPILASAAQADEPPKPITVTAYRWAPFISPMGEPFRSRAPDDDPFARWFHQADGNRDGMLTADEMRADAERFFAALDSNQDGRIDSEERMTYELEIAPEVQVNSQWKRTRQETAAQARSGDDRGSWRSRRRRDNDIDGYQLDGLQGAARYGLLNLRSQLPVPMRISTASSRWTNSGAPPRTAFNCSTAIAQAGSRCRTSKGSCPPGPRRAAASNAPRMPSTRESVCRCLKETRSRP